MVFFWCLKTKPSKTLFTAHTLHLPLSLKKYIFIDYTYILLSLCSETCLVFKYKYLLI